MKILITYDYITTNSVLGKSLSSKLTFFKEILNCLDQSVVIDDKNYKSFSPKKLFDLENITYKEENFKSIDLSTIKSDSKDYIKSYIKGFDFLITFELSKETRAFFDDESIPYFDLWMSPIRFYKDIMFSFHSNIKEIQDKLLKYKICDEELFTSANEIKNYCKYLKKDNINLEKNSILIVGQLFQDKAILKNGVFLNLLDYKKEIFELSKGYNRIYFLKHPLMKEEEFETILNGFSQLSNIEYLTDVNIYSLLSKEEVKKVVAISSSVLYESRFFKKEVEYLYQPVLKEEYVNIYNAFYTSSFWNDILGLNLNKDVKFIVNDNFLRYKFDAFYAYKYFNNDTLIKQSYSSVTNIYNFCEKIDKSKDYILYGYGSVGKIIAALLKESVKAVVDNSIQKNEINSIDGLNVIDISELNSNDIVIITPFLYNNEIKSKLSSVGCEIIEIEVG